MSAKAFAKSVLDYQRGRVPEVGAGETLWAALESDGGPVLGPEDFKPPEALVAPYLLIDGNDSLAVNLNLATESVKQRGEGERVFAAVPIPREYLTAPASLEHIIAEYGKIDLNGLLIWVADFKEWDEDQDYLYLFAQFIRNLKTARPNRRVINLFGSFYSAMLTGRGALDGAVQGVGISEHRDPYATGGGGVQRYYLPVSHQSVGTDLATDLKQSDPTLFECNCPHCPTGSTPTSMSTADLAKHFISVRTGEVKWCAETPPASITTQLTAAKTKLLSAKGATAGVAHAHGRQVEIWAKTVSKLAQDGLLS